MGPRTTERIQVEVLHRYGAYHICEQIILQHGNLLRNSNPPTLEFGRSIYPRHLNGDNGIVGRHRPYVQERLENLMKLATPCTRSQSHFDDYVMSHD